MLDPQRIVPTHADLFIERYERLRAWALQLTERDHERAEDLLHDAFIQFTLSKTDPQSIKDLDSYLFVGLRNLHLSQMRRATRSSARELSIVEYDSAELGLWAIDPRDQIKTQDELRTVCHYACMRKKTAKAGSVLILRFFHGYYPEEVARVLRISRAAVKDRLRLARAETRLYLSDSSRLNLMHDDHAVERPRAEIGRVSDDLLNELRQTIFASREGACFAEKELQDFYAQDGEKGLDCATVAHLVSCAKCLDEVNKLLGLPLLSERYATDMIGKDTRKKGGPGGGSSGKGEGGVRASLGKYIRRAHQVYRHEPQELCIAVNGYLQGTQKISSEQSELSLVIDMAEQIGFVEVFSELGIRLLLLNVEPLPVGPVRQETRVALSEGRTLDATLSFSGAWPTLHVVYSDPLISDGQEPLAATDFESPTLAVKQVSLTTVPAASAASLIEREELEPARSGLAKFLSYLRRHSLRNLFGSELWLRPGMITAVFAILLIAAAMLVWRTKLTPPPTAADLLLRATQAEDAAMSRPDTVIHRTLQIEERRGSADGEVVARLRVEVWQSAAKAVTARRLYDDQGRLLAGEWIRSDNVTTFYHHGTKPQLRQAGPPESQINLDNVWQLSPSAKDFAALVGQPNNLRLEERANHYVVNFENASPTAMHRLLQVTLILGRDDLHATEETLVIQQEKEVRAYRISETSYERRPVNAVAPAVFEPEQELLGEVGRWSREENARLREPVPTGGPSAPPVLATAELEVEVLRLLNSAGGDLSDQVSVTRTPEGRLRVEGTVETPRRKAEIMRALASVSRHPAVTIAVQTVAEATERQSANPTRSVELQQIEISKSELPVAAELRRYFAARGLSQDQLDQEMNRFASRVMRRSLQARLYARTLKQTLNRFSPDDLRTLTPGARQELMALIREQASNLQRETSTLRSELQVIVPGASATSGSEQMEISSDVDLLRAVNRLAELVAQTDEGVRTSFSISSEGTTSAPVREARFWRVLKSTESLAARIASKQ